MEDWKMTPKEDELRAIAAKLREAYESGDDDAVGEALTELETALAESAPPPSDPLAEDAT
jgi:hypothetical protein